MTTLLAPLGRQIVQQTHGRTATELYAISARATAARYALLAAKEHLRVLADEGASVRDLIQDIEDSLADEVAPLIDNARAEAELVEGIEQIEAAHALTSRRRRVA